MHSTPDDGEETARQRMEAQTMVPDNEGSGTDAMANAAAAPIPAFPSTQHAPANNGSSNTTGSSSASHATLLSSSVSLAAAQCHNYSPRNIEPKQLLIRSHRSDSPTHDTEQGGVSGNDNVHSHHLRASSSASHLTPWNAASSMARSLSNHGSPRSSTSPRSPSTATGLNLSIPPISNISPILAPVTPSRSTLLTVPGASHHTPEARHSATLVLTPVLTAAASSPRRRPIPYIQPYHRPHARSAAAATTLLASAPARSRTLTSTSSSSLHASPSMPPLPPPAVIALSSINVSPVPSAKEELRSIWKLSYPVAFAILFRVSMAVTDLAMLGHLDTDYLAAASAAFIWINITSAFLYRAFGSALNTLASQAHGAGNFRLVGIWLQQALVFSTIGMIPVGVLWVFTGPMLRLLTVESHVANLAQTFADWSLLWLPAQIWMEMLQRYFQAQHIIFPALVINAIFVFVNAFLNLLLLFGIPAGWLPRAFGTDVHDHGWGGLGFKGSPIATTIARWMMLLCYILYCFVYRKYHTPTFHGWSLNRREALHPARIREYLFVQALPSAVAISLEEWQLEIIAIFATKLGATQIATHNSTLELFFFLTSFMFGLITAVQIRIGNYLGSGNAAAAKQVAKIGLQVSVAIGLVIGTLFMSCRVYVGRIYSSDPQIWQQASEISIVVGACYAALSIFYTAMSVINAQGRPVIVAVAYLLGCWVVCLPLAYVFAFVCHYGLIGLWYGLIVGYGVVTLIVGVAAYRSDWDKYVHLAQARAEKKKAEMKGGVDPIDNQAERAKQKEKRKKERKKRKEERRKRREQSLKDQSTHQWNSNIHVMVGIDSINTRTEPLLLTTSNANNCAIQPDVSWSRATGRDSSSSSSDSSTNDGMSEHDHVFSSSSDVDDAWNAEEVAYREAELEKQRQQSFARLHDDETMTPTTTNIHANGSEPAAPLRSVRSFSSPAEMHQAVAVATAVQQTHADADGDPTHSAHSGHTEASNSIPPAPSSSAQVVLRCPPSSPPPLAHTHSTSSESQPQPHTPSASPPELHACADLALALTAADANIGASHDPANLLHVESAISQMTAHLLPTHAVNSEEHTDG